MDKTTAQRLVENSTDATRGQPLAIRAQQRMVELEAALASLPADERLARNDLELLLASLGALLTGDVEHMSDTTASTLSQLLETNKHIAESATPPSSPCRSLSIRKV
jgi:hypothetical protein